jgi:hypothetical protein
MVFEELKARNLGGRRSHFPFRMRKLLLTQKKMRAYVQVQDSRFIIYAGKNIGNFTIYSKGLRIEQFRLVEI